jgi:hypothetical protein
MSDKKITNKEKIKILKEAAILAEMAYRRGFQHGVVISRQHKISDNVSHDFRYGRSVNKAYAAPEPKLRSLYDDVVVRHIDMEALDYRQPTLIEWRRVTRTLKQSPETKDFL